MKYTAIGTLWTKYVKNGTYNLEQVPPLWRDEVKERTKPKKESSDVDDESAGGSDEDR